MRNKKSSKRKQEGKCTDKKKVLEKVEKEKAERQKKGQNAKMTRVISAL